MSIKYFLTSLLICISFFAFNQQNVNINAKVFINGSLQNAIQPDSISIHACLGDSIKITINPRYPNSFESTGLGYSQNNTNVTRKWFLPNNVTINDNFEVNFVVTNTNGFSVIVLLTDNSNFEYFKNLFFYIGVKPNFGLLNITPDPVCTNGVITLHGGIDATDSTSNNFTTPPGIVTASDILADTTFLPDGSGASYQSSINILTFNPGQTVSNSCGIESICLNMEHSYLGDLDITITCPNNTTISLVSYINSNSGGEYLGQPIDNGNTLDIGTGANYCFSNSGTQTMDQAAASVASGSMMPATTYLPVDAFSGLNGCPLNGTWTITVTDNILADNGYIFSWGVNFDACQYTSNMTYQNKPVSGGWVNVNNVSFQSPDSTVTIASTNNFMFEVTDNFGCKHDTTLTITIQNPPLQLNYTGGVDCNDSSVVLNQNIGGPLGQWTCVNSSGVTFTPPNNISTTAHVPSYGDYQFVFTESSCNQDDTVTIKFRPDQYVDLFTELKICRGYEQEIQSFPFADYAPYITNYIWTKQGSSTVISNSNSINVTEAGYYICTVTGECASFSDSTLIIIKDCDIEIPNTFTPNGDGENDIFKLLTDDVDFFKTFNISIVNRWGNIVAEFSVPDFKWDGKDKSGNIVETGVYFYNITSTTIEDTELKKQGFIQVFTDK